MEQTHPFAHEKTLSTDRLLMLGICLKNSVGYGHGPILSYATTEDLRKVKLPHPEIAAHLKALMETGKLTDCWIWNTCNRFEVYAFSKVNLETAEETLLGTFFGPLLETEVRINHLVGDEVIHHLLRTIVGLNSGLPGETDVEQQLQVALRISECCGALSTEANAFIEKIIEEADKARAETEWANFSPSYCQASMEGAFANLDREKVLSGSIAIIGSSNTTRSCVERLEQDFGVDPDQITFFHRCHKSNGTVKSIRRASMGCHRKKVDDYDSPEVFEAISRASLVIFGIDRDKPIMTGEQIRALRTEPFVLMDYNTLGSTEGVVSDSLIAYFDAQRLELEVRAYADRMQADPRFASAIEEVEAHIIDRIQTVDFCHVEIPCCEETMIGADH